MFVLGSFHCLPPNLNWFTSKIEKSFKNSDIIIAELASSQETTLAFEEKLAPGGSALSKDSLSNFLGNNVYSKLNDILESSGVPRDSYEFFKPWCVYMLLSGLCMIQAGLTDHGVDDTLEQLALKKGLTPVGLETAEEQLDIFSSIKLTTLKKLITDIVLDFEKVIQLNKDLYNGWISGDIKGLETAAFKSLKKYPDVLKYFITLRNKKWLPKLETYLREPKINFVYVGTLHLLGEGNILELLEEKGYSVIRE